MGFQVALLIFHQTSVCFAREPWLEFRLMSFQKFCALMATFIAALPAQGKLTPEQIARLPAPAPVKVDFARDVKPIFDSACVKCHGKGKDKGGLSIETRDSFMKGGDSGVPIVSGKSAESLIIELVAGFDPETVMPQKGSKLKPEQIALLRAWIDQGANWPADISFKKLPVNNLHPRKPIAPVVPNTPNLVDRFLVPYFESHGIKPAPPVEDRLFARRVYLDVIGVLPSPEELDEFVSDSRPNKRDRLVTKLLRDNRRYAEHWLTFWNDLLRNDYKGAGSIDGGRRQISNWLFNSLYTNKPYNSFVAELVHPNLNSVGFVNGFIWRGAVNASQTQPLQAAQNISQVFLGVNLKCASCHDSFINDYTLADAYGLAAVYATNNLDVAECDKPTGRTAHAKFLYPELGTLDGTLPMPKRTQQLADILTSRSNGRLTRTVVNRLWAKFMGRGLVEPVDDMDAPAWSADVLDWLADEMADSNYDLRRVMWWILTSRAYQMPAVDPGETTGNDYKFTGPLVKRMTAEQFRDALGQLSDVWFTLPEEGLKLTEIGTAGRTNKLLPDGARWIWINPLHEKPANTFLRKSFQLTNVPPSAYATAVGDFRFTIQINGANAGQGRNPVKPTFIALQPYLRVGENVIAVTLGERAPTPTQKPDGAVKDEIDDSRPPAFFFAAIFPGEKLDLWSDTSWRSSREKIADWERAGFEATGWTNALTLGGNETWLRGMTDRLEESLGFSLVHQKTRASLVAADPLLVALGRPTREQVASTRQTAATTLQALELTNGETLNKVIQRGAAKWLNKSKHSAPELVSEVFVRSLGRLPSTAELQMATQLIGSPAKQEGVEDLLWSVAMLPEFQLIY